ncbi:uncharacterized protein LOC121413037 [Lytechinus variegatus]|uniref:uncharacterized protein LOC121413037 n=1 Tax=Lytechinus variegatus TaxID=7654 RepID=UPI001BB1CE02|nr:uncharacterized protein LOC121413037 [Lytechinus variegatus]
MDLAGLMAAGKEFGLTGEALKKFVSDEQKKQRDERAELLELKKREKETAEIQLEIEREKNVKGESKSVGQRAWSPKLPPFHEDKDNIDAYLQRFERYADTQNWPRADWAINLSALLTGKALDVHSRLTSDEAKDYKTLKTALLKAFQLTSEGFRSKFYTGKPVNGETASQYSNRLENYLNRWIELSGVKHDFDDLKDLLLREHFINGCHRDLSIFLRERQPKTTKDAMKFTEQYLEARGGVFRAPPPQRNIPTGQTQRINTRHEGNIPGVRPAEQPDPQWTLPETVIPVCAVQTRAQVQREGKPFRPLKTPHPMEEVVIPSVLKETQQKDETLHRLRELADAGTEKVSRHHNKSSFFYKDGILYRSFLSSKDSDTVVTQVVVPKQYRKQVMQTAHENLLGGHQGAKKTTEKILTNFFWPGMNSDITRYVRSCDICQRTLARGRVTKVPLGKMPIIEVPFERIAIDIVGPIHPMTENKNRYILTIVDYATRYPEAIPLPSIETERVAEALVSVFTRVGIPKEMLTDQGTQFTSDLMKEVSKLLSIRHFTTSPYHPAANGLVERFNGSLKQMLKRMCAENPKDWDRYITPLLFAVREAPQESMGFSPFELLYGRKVRGPLDILKELWTGEAETAETKSTYQYILDLRNRIDETCRNAHTQLQKSSERYARYYNQKAKHREFQIGDRVLLLLPTDRNKLLLQWKGPFEVVSKVSSTDYRIDLNGKLKVFHINLLKKYHDRNNTSPSLSDTVTACSAVIECEDNAEDENTPSSSPLTNRSLLQPFPLQAKESLADVTINPDLSPSQKEQVNALLNNYKDVMSDLPNRTSLGEHNILLKVGDHKQLKSKPYPIPHSLRDTVRDEVKTMLSMGVIEPSDSPIASPIVLVKKPDGSNRFCVDYRKLNKVTVFDAEPIPDQDELFTKVAHAKYFTKIDLSKGYWQVPMSHKSKPLTAFLTPDGLFQFTVMPFGLVNAPASFSRMMRRLLKGLDGAVNYIDDILIHSTTWDQHLATLTELLSRLRAAKLTARPSKCFVGHSKVEFLGHVIEDGTVSPRPEKLKAIQEISRPHTKRELRSFLGMTNYYRKFIPNYSAISAPLTDRTRKDEPNQIRWETNQEQAFNTLKDKLTNPPILHLPDLSTDFILRTDASNVGIGAVLLQTHEEERFPVAYASRKLLRREQAYSTIERECLAIIWAVRKFEPYLYGRQFVLETDHQPLTYMNSVNPANGRLMRWILALQPYRFRVEAIRGSDNVGADVLSRL